MLSIHDINENINFQLYITVKESITYNLNKQVTNYIFIAPRGSIDTYKYIIADCI